MAAMAHGWARSDATILGRWFRAVGERWEAWSAARADHRLVAAEARFFDAYCRGGSHQRDLLVIDYSFMSRPRVRDALRRVTRGDSLDIPTLENEFLLAEPSGDLAAFRANAENLSRCVAALA